MSTYTPATRQYYEEHREEILAKSRERYRQTHQYSCEQCNRHFATGNIARAHARVFNHKIILNKKLPQILKG